MTESTRSDALKKAQKKYAAKTKEQQKHWQYHSRARKFINEMASRDELDELSELIKKRQLLDD